MANWWWKANYFESCNCAHGCPCNVTAIPTDGTCKGINVWEIREGRYGDVQLGELSLAQFVAWPNPIHEGNGQAIIYIDERANAAQREALTQIATGKAGAGGPFEIFASTYSQPPEVFFGPVQLKQNGKVVTMDFGDMAHSEIEPTHSAMDNSVTDVRMVIPNGFIWQSAEIANTKVTEVNTQSLRFRMENSNAFLSEVEYNL